MSEPAMADWIRVLCFGACALKWRIAEFVRELARAEDMLEEVIGVSSALMARVRAVS